MASPIPFRVADSGDAADAPGGAVPIALYGEAGGGSTTVAWADVTGKPATFPPTVGTTATTAAAGNHSHTYASITAKPATIAAIPATLGTAGQVLAVNAAGTGLEWVTPA